MKRYQITVNGKAYDVSVDEIGAGAAPAAVSAPAPAAAPAPAPAPAAAPAPAPAPAAAPAGSAGSVKVNAPMPGNILDVKVQVGAAVKLGDPLVVLEAMKMENDIVAPQDGTVAAIHVKKGDTVNSNDLLVSLN